MDYSVARASALALFSEMLERKGVLPEELPLFWEKAVRAAELFSEFALTPRLELKKEDFTKDSWGFLKKHLKLFAELGWITMKGCDAVIIHREKYSAQALKERVARRKPPKGPKQVIVERRTVVRREEEDKPVLSRADYVHIFVDFPNLSCEKMAGGKCAIHPERIDWKKLKHHLSLYHGVAHSIAPPLKNHSSGAILFVSGEYFSHHAGAFLAAKEAGFEVISTEGKDDVDARVQAAFMNAGIRHLDGYANLPVISLLSGDKDHRHHLLVLKEYAELKGLSLRLKITSWQRALSDDLRVLATDTPIYVEEILSSICPSALDRRAA